MENNAFIYSSKQVSNIVEFISESHNVATISSDGIMRFTIDANDENAVRFVECIEGVIKRRLSGVEATMKARTGADE